MEANFHVRLAAEQMADLQLMATLSGVDKAYLFREWIRYNKAWMEEYLNEHEFKPGRAIGCSWMAGPYNPAGIRHNDTAYDEWLKVKYAAQIETIKIEKANLEKLKLELDAERIRLEIEQKDKCAKCRILGDMREDFEPAIYVDDETRLVQKTIPPVRRDLLLNSISDLWNSLSDEQQRGLTLLLWCLVIIGGLVGAGVWFFGHAAGRW